MLQSQLRLEIQYYVQARRLGQLTEIQNVGRHNTGVAFLTHAIQSVKALNSFQLFCVPRFTGPTVKNAFHCLAHSFEYLSGLDILKTQLRTSRRGQVGWHGPLRTGDKEEQVAEIAQIVEVRVEFLLNGAIV